MWKPTILAALLQNSLKPIWHSQKGTTSAQHLYLTLNAIKTYKQVVKHRLDDSAVKVL
jgi:hypothetical protein